MRVSMLVRLFKPRRISSTTVNSKNLRTWSGGNVNLLFLPNFGFTKFNQKSNFSSKQESYFSAIGGESDDPPPELTPEQVTNILTMNEVKFFSSGRIKTIECNQLAANNPTEDRLRVSKLNLKEFNPSSDNSSAQEATIFAVFDGHGGRLCADIITKRLFSYIALALCSDPVNVASDAQNLDKIVEDLQMIPNVTKSLNLSYGPLACERINGVTKERTKYYLEKYAQKLKETSFQSIEDKLVDAFLQCDQDLSDEIEHGLENPISNVLIHYYLSMAVSGCCVTLLMVHGDDCYIASTGDCKAVLGFREAGPANYQVTKSIDLTNEHNSDNAAETKRLLSSHPSNEKKTIIRNDRLLSHLMPFRAFGDFCYKWEIDKIKKVGLTKAFGLHIIPPNYLTPPYLTAKPEVSKISLSSKTDATIGDRFIVIATDGLWEQYGSSRCLIKQLFRHHFRLSSSFSSSNENLSVPKKVDSYQSYQHEEVSKKIVQHAQSKKASCDDEQPKEDEDFIDINSSTHLIRVALGTPPLPNMVQDDDLVPYQLQHKRLSTFLTLPPHLVRNFRDDITVIVLKLD